MQQLNQEYSAENVYIAKINTFQFVQKNCSGQQLFNKKVVFNKLHVFFWWIRKSLIALLKIGMIEISHCFVKNTIILLYAVKKQLNKPERYFQI